MTGTRNRALGWLVWTVGKRVAKKKARENPVKLGAAGAVALALAGGVIASRAASRA
jgi:hypothetical protein